MIEYTLLDRKKAEVYQAYLTPEVYERRLEKKVFFYGASTETEIVGVAALEAGQESELLSVAVSPAWQRQGIGSELVDRAGDLLKENGASLFTTYLSGTEEEIEGLDTFLWRCGFNLTEEQPVGNFIVEDAKESEILKKAAGTRMPKEVCTLSEVPAIVEKTFANYLQTQDQYYGWDSGRIRKDLSAVYLEKQGITACVLLSEGEEKELILEFAYVDAACHDQLALLHLLGHSLNLISEKYPKDTKMSIITMNPVSENILTKILGENLKRESIRRYEIELSR